MLQPGRPSLEEKPRARFLRKVGGLLLVAGLALNVSLMVRGVDVEFRLAMLVLAPGLIMLFTAFLAENTPSMRGCLTIFAVAMAFVAAFWAWVGVSVALSPEDEPPELLQEQQAPANEVDEPGEDAPADGASPDGDASGEEPSGEDPSGEDPPSDETSPNDVSTEQE